MPINGILTSTNSCFLMFWNQLTIWLYDKCSDTKFGCDKIQYSELQITISATLISFWNILDKLKNHRENEMMNDKRSTYINQILFILQLWINMLENSRNLFIRFFIAEPNQGRLNKNLNINMKEFSNQKKWNEVKYFSNTNRTDDSQSNHKSTLAEISSHGWRMFLTTALLEKIWSPFSSTMIGRVFPPRSLHSRKIKQIINENSTERGNAKPISFQKIRNTNVVPLRVTYSTWTDFPAKEEASKSFKHSGLFRLV